jgi:DNA-binding NarL/FixJ family response regulator
VISDAKLSGAGFDVFVASENRLLRDVMAKLLRKKPGIRSVTAAAFSHGILQQLAEAQAQILLLDPGRATGPMLQLVKQFKEATPRLQVIVIGMEADPETFLRYVEAGIAGYVLKDASGSDLAEAVLSVGSGLAVCPADLCLGLFQYVARRSWQIQDVSLQPQCRLTNREQQLMTQLRSGFTNKEIAAELNLSEQTVKNHIHHILRKLGAPDRLAAAGMWRAPA